MQIYLSGKRARASGAFGFVAASPYRRDLDLADTGIVRLEARMRRAADLNQMPIHVDLDWRAAQLASSAADCWFDPVGAAISRERCN